jgi:MFS family permease
VTTDAAFAAVPRMQCRGCGFDVPSGNFCGRCGLHSTEDRSERRRWLRPATFGAAPNEKVLRPYLLSALFPHLPNRSRRPFRWTLVIATVALFGFALLRLPAAGVAVAALGLPLLFVLYVRASGVGRDMSRFSLILAALLGAVLGIAWVLVSGSVVANNYGVPMSVGLAVHHLLGAGFAIPTVGMILMTVPAFVIRLRPSATRESLDGFVIGALGALAFTAAATLTRLAPQFTTGLFAHARPVKGLVVEAALCGITVPVTGAAAGGMVGLMLWYRHPDSDDADDHPRRVRVVLALLAAAALLIHAAAGVIDIVGLAQTPMLVLHLLMALLILIALRVALQLALLHETHDPINEDQPLLCIACEMVVPDMAFCPACGVATRASSRESRRERRGISRPQPAVDSPVGQIYPGYALPSGSYTALAPRQPRFGWLLGRWGVAISAVVVALGGVALVLTPKIAHYMCPPECGHPPTGTPVMSLPRFQAPNGAFSVAYPAEGSAYTISTESAGVTATFTGGDGGVMQLYSEPARGRSAKDVAKAAVRKSYPDATFAYEIPNAMVGYQPGYGEAADDWPQGSAAAYSRVRIIVMAAVKNDVALIAFATGPYRAFGPDSGPGIPSGANLQLAQDMGKYVNSFQWSGDPDR